MHILTLHRTRLLAPLLPGLWLGLTLACSTAPVGNGVGPVSDTGSVVIQELEIFSQDAIPFTVDINPGGSDSDTFAGGEDSQVVGESDTLIAQDSGVLDTFFAPDSQPKTGCTPTCSIDQLCVQGVCTAVTKPCNGACGVGYFCDVGGSGLCKPSTCTLPTTFSADVQKVSFMQIALTSQGCDLTGDGKANNVFGKLLKIYPAANTELIKSIQDGLFILLFEADDWKTDGSIFALNGYLGELDSSNPNCSPTASFTNCKYTVDESNFGAGASGICPVQVHVAPAKVTSGWLTAGGQKGQTMTIKLPVVGGFNVTISSAKMEGQVTAVSSWQRTKKGRICGVMTVQDFKKALDAVPASVWQQINLDKATAEQVLATFLAPDIDLNQDGTPDAISMALLYETVPGQITKVTY